MATTVGELNRKLMQEALDAASAEDLVKRLTPKQRLEGLPADEILKALPSEERLKGLPAEERLKGLLPEEIEAYLRTLKKEKPKGN